MTLSEQLKTEIRRRVSPLSMEDYREPEVGIRFSVHTLRDGVSVYPEPESLESLAHFIRIGPPGLVAFDIDDADDVLKLFIARNFGVYYKTMFMDSVLEKIDVANFEITNVESLANAIQALSSPVPRAWIYPRQFILTLGELLRESHKSFIFAPSLDLFEDAEKERLGDLDIVCIQDGKLVIGEVKTSVSGFGSDDFDKMEFVAKHIRPDVLIFSAEKGCTSDKPREPERVRQLRTELKSLEIEVRWLCVGSDLKGD